MRAIDPCLPLTRWVLEGRADTTAGRTLPPSPVLQGRVKVGLSRGRLPADEVLGAGDETGPGRLGPQSDGLAPVASRSDAVCQDDAVRGNDLTRDVGTRHGSRPEMLGRRLGSAGVLL
jgi:hypothetical protein